MGQLDPVEINETFLSGFLCSIAVGYVALGIESTIESLKMYIISSVSLVTGKAKKFYIRGLARAIRPWPLESELAATSIQCEVVGQCARVPGEQQDAKRIVTCMLPKTVSSAELKKAKNNGLFKFVMKDF
jgi:hypothetical protein